MRKSTYLFSDSDSNIYIYFFIQEIISNVYFVVDPVLGVQLVLEMYQEENRSVLVEMGIH